VKVYGFDDTDVVRGELQATEADTGDLRFPDELQARLGWDYLSRRFVEAQAALIAKMKEEGSDPDLIGPVRGMKASYVPVDDYG